MITKLTKSQEKRIPKYIEKWVNKASEPLNRKKTVKITKEFFGDDKTVLIAESIQNAIDIIKFIADGKEVKYDSQLDSQKITYSYYTTQFWYSWYGYYDFAKSIGVQFDEEKFKRMGDIILSIPTIITLGNILIVIENPKCRWNNRNLHSDEFPAIEWKDNTGIYFLNAVLFEKELWEKVVSRKMTLKEVLEIVDIDQRTQAMRYVDVEDLLVKYNAETLDTFTKTTPNGDLVNYKLVFIPKHDTLFRVDSYHAVYNCPSTDKRYMSGIAPEIGANKDIKEAMAWKAGLSVDEWLSLIPLVTES